jgi:hypothetical protein
LTHDKTRTYEEVRGDFKRAYTAGLLVRPPEPKETPQEKRINLKIKQKTKKGKKILQEFIIFA